MRALLVGVVFATAAWGCLTAVQKGPGQDATEPDPGDDTVTPWDVSGDPGHTPDQVTPADGVAPDQAPPDDVQPADLPPEEVEPACDFQVSSFVVQDGRTHLRVGEMAHIEARTSAEGIPITFVADGVPDGANFVDHGDGTCDLEVKDQTMKSRTTAVTITLHATHLGCEVVKSVSIKVVGTVWATEIDHGVVQVFRSDGKFLGQGVPSGKTSDPWSLLELGPERILVGSRHR